MTHLSNTEEPDKVQNRSPAKLKDLAIAEIAKNVQLSKHIIQDKHLLIPDVKQALSQRMPFFDDVPKEIKRVILLLLPVNEWRSLFYVNHDWNTLIKEEANLCLDSCKEDLHSIHATIIDEHLNELVSKVEDYSYKTGRRADQVEKIKQLESEVALLTHPLAKLFHCKQILKDIVNNIKKEYPQLWFTYVRHGSQLYDVINPFYKIFNEKTESPWFKKAMLYLEFSPCHPVSQFFSEGSLEINELKNSRNKDNDHRSAIA